MKEHGSFHILFFATLAIFFGWGVVWVGVQGARIAYESDNAANQTANIITGFARGYTADKAQTLDIMIAGDIMMDRKIRLLGEMNGYDSLFASITPLFKQADITVANLEGPITSNPSKTLLPNNATTKALMFTFATSTAQVLADAGIDVVSLANNHVDNFGVDGYNETREWLDRAGVKYFGDPWNGSTTEAVITKNGFTVAFVGYHQFQPGFARIIADVKHLKADGDFVIVMPHWGVEYQATSTSLQKEQARELAAAGADAIIGSHPHVIGERGSLDGVPVFYSLGNLLFDQYFSPGVMKGNVVELKIGKGSTGIAHIQSIDVYATSLASKTHVTYDPTPEAFSF